MSHKRRRPHTSPQAQQAQSPTPTAASATSRRGDAQPTHIRIPYFDNAKYLLITLVVVGHIIKFDATSHCREARALALWIYSFHMPAFIFLSGLFLSREHLNARNVLPRAGTYLSLAFLAKLLRKSVPFIQGRTPQLDFLAWGDLPWFMLCLAVFYLLAWLLKRCNVFVVGVVSVALALAAGYTDAIGDTFCLSRILVFFPFFWLGHALSPQQVLDHFAGTRTRIVCIGILVASAAICLHWTKELFPWRDFFTGRYSYAASSLEGCSWVTRLEGYAVSLVMTYGFLGVVPRRFVPLATYLGTQTLQVYLLHYELIEILHRREIISTALAKGDQGWLLVVAMGVLMVPVLGLPKISLPSVAEVMGEREA